MNPTSLPQASPTDAWNQAYDRLVQFLDAFALADHPHVARLAMGLLDEAQKRRRDVPSHDPTTLTMELTQQAIADWLGQSLGKQEQPTPEILASGYLALLLSGVPQKAPAAFLIAPLSDEVRQAMHRTLLVVGPDLAVSSMTPRHLDYGPMVNLANQTWNRRDAREVVVAVLFWIAVYVLLYNWLSV